MKKKSSARKKSRAKSMICDCGSGKMAKDCCKI